jgi:hypothetical protein
MAVVMALLACRERGPDFEFAAFLFSEIVFGTARKGQWRGPFARRSESWASTTVITMPAGAV